MKLKTIIMTIVLPLSFNSFAQLTAVDYKDGEQVLSGFGIKPKTELKDKPGVLVLPAWFGIDGHSKRKCSQVS